jgi:hypothetical protein
MHRGLPGIIRNRSTLQDLGYRVLQVTHDHAAGTHVAQLYENDGFLVDTIRRHDSFDK